MEIAERVSIVSNADVKPDKSSTDSSAVADAHPSDGRTKGFRIFSDVIWAELGSAIMDELGTVVFASGKPNEFKKVRPQYYLYCTRTHFPAALRHDTDIYSVPRDACSVAAFCRVNAQSSRLH